MRKKHVPFFVIKSIPCSVFLLKSYVTFSYDCLCMRKKNMFKFLLLKVPHVQFFVIIKAMLHSVLIVCI
jgi:hypothetical protein